MLRVPKKDKVVIILEELKEVIEIPKEKSLDVEVALMNALIRLDQDT